VTLSTTALRNAWAPACTGPFTTMPLHGEGRITIRSSTVYAWHALNACLVRHDYRTRRADTGAYNCRKITGGSGWSLHAYGIAADLNWQSNPYGPRLITDMPPEMVADILAIRTKSGAQVFRWGGHYRTNKDAMHFEIVCAPDDIRSGIAGETPQPPKPPANVRPPTPEDTTTPEQEKMLREIHEQLTVSRDDKAKAGPTVRWMLAKANDRLVRLLGR